MFWHILSVSLLLNGLKFGIMIVGLKLPLRPIIWTLWIPVQIDGADYEKNTET